VGAGAGPGDDDSAVMAPSPSSERLPCALHREEHARRAGRPEGRPWQPYAPRMRETV
jgi:hypothetical protein